MGNAIHNLLRRWGFVKLDPYGLILTPDGRVLSTRPAVLDDGLGGRIVGWLEGDLAAMELEKWGQPAAPAPKRPALPLPPPPIAPPVAARPPTPPPIAPRPLPGVPPMRPVLVAPPAPAPVVVAPVVDEPEDDWEWNIAMARARAAAEWAEEAAAAGPPKAVPKLVAAIPTIAPPARLAPAAKPIAVTPSTRIPVPKLPSVDPRSIRPAAVAHIAPLRSMHPTAVAPRKFPRATGRVDDTIRTHAVAAANDDKTSPLIELPEASSARRVAAKQR